ncbi:MAG: hypothetical protein AAFO07_29545 [Bacteroidota bacterium]
MKTSCLLIIIGMLAFGLHQNVIAQVPLSTLTQDTIVQLPTFLNTTYLLDGKRLTPQVMEWFMKDVPSAHENIRLSMISDQISITGYTLGSLFVLSSFFIPDENAKTSRNLRTVGGISILSGICLQIVGNDFKKKSVNQYNQSIKALHQAKQQSKELKLEVGGLQLRGVLIF